MSAEIIKVVTIPPDKSVSLEIGGMFYQRLNKLLIEFGDSVPKQKLLFAIDLIKRDRAVKDQYAYNLETLIILMRDIEKAFNAAGLTTEEEISLDPDKIINQDQT